MTYRAGLTLDTGALVACERNSKRAWSIIRDARDNGRSITVPVVVLAESWRKQHRWLKELFDAARVEPLTDPLARRAGELLGQTGTDNTLDAIVAVSAHQRGDIIVTADPDDLLIYVDHLAGVRLVQV